MWHYCREAYQFFGGPRPVGWRRTAPTSICRAWDGGCKLGDLDLSVVSPEMPLDFGMGEPATFSNNLHNLRQFVWHPFFPDG